MKTLRLPLTILCALALSALSTYAAQLASAKVLKVEGSVAKYPADGGQSTPLAAGDILTEGDSISASALSSAFLVFSNGTEITVEENTGLTIAKLEQAPFGGSQSYEQLQADPSQSQTLLELNYGEVGFHVKKLQPGSAFDIETPLGTAAIRGTRGSVNLFYNTQAGVFTLVISNVDGLVDFQSRYSGGLDFSTGSAEVSFNGDSPAKSEGIPQGGTVTMRIDRNDPIFPQLFEVFRNFEPTDPPADKPSPVNPGVITLPDLVLTPEDPGVIIVSPEDGDIPEQNLNN